VAVKEKFIFGKCLSSIAFTGIPFYRAKKLNNKI
jgi:hypothetical protein